MKKGYITKICLTMFALCIIFLQHSTVFAKNDDGINQANVKARPISISEDVKISQRLHLKAINNKALQLDDNQHLIVNKDLLNPKDKEWTIYSEYVKSMNEIVDLGIGNFNTSFQLVMYDKNYIANQIYRQRYNICKNNDYYADTHSLVTLGKPSGLPKLNAYKIAQNNRNEIINFMNTILVSNPSQPAAATSATTGYWVGKVKTGGAWDYKNVKGFTPYNKKWNAVQRYTTSTKTSEWFGNYNYGFTGSVLFSKKILLAGGDAVSWVHNGETDSKEDKAAIKQGYNESK